MQLSIDHPTDRPNFTRIDVGDVTVWFSYSTPVAFRTPEHGRVVCENVWSVTTGGHLAQIDGRRTAKEKKERTPRAEFLALLDSIEFGVVKVIS